MTCPRVDPVPQVIQLGVDCGTSALANSTEPIRPNTFLAVAATLSAPNNLATQAQVVARSEHGQRKDSITPSSHRRHDWYSLRPRNEGCGSSIPFGFKLQHNAWPLGWCCLDWPLVHG